MGDINRIPRGYLNMLGSQTGGKNPFQAAELVNPVVDMTPFYHADRLSVQSDTFIPANAGVVEIFSLDVPSDESWFLYSVEIQYAAVAVGNRMQWAVGLRRLPNNVGPQGIASIFNPGDITPQGAFFPSVAAAQINFPVPYPLQGGSELTYSYQAGNVNPATTFNLVIARLRG